MAIPHGLSRKLHEIFGIEAADAMADWMNGIEGGQDELRGDLGEMRHEMRREFASVREEMRAQSSSLREEMHTLNTALREEMHEQNAALREEMHEQNAVLRDEMRAGFAAMRQEMAALRTEIAVSKVDVLKWAIGSWIGSLALITALIRFAR